MSQHTLPNIYTLRRYKSISLKDKLPFEAFRFINITFMPNGFHVKLYMFTHK